MELTNYICSCGSSYSAESTKGGDIRLEVCSNCHPAYTGGDARMLDTEGRIERFRKKYGSAKK